MVRGHHPQKPFTSAQEMSWSSTAPIPLLCPTYKLEVAVKAEELVELAGAVLEALALVPASWHLLLPAHQPHAEAHRVHQLLQALHEPPVLQLSQGPLHNSPSSQVNPRLAEALYPRHAWLA